MLGELREATNISEINLGHALSTELPKFSVEWESIWLQEKYEQAVTNCKTSIWVSTIHTKSRKGKRIKLMDSIQNPATTDRVNELRSNFSTLYDVGFFPINFNSQSLGPFLLIRTCNFVYLTIYFHPYMGLYD
jgi:hypothetical protein